MAHYEVRITNLQGGSSSIVMELDRPDDMAALNSALQLCRNQKVEVWEGSRQVGSALLSGIPQLGF